MGKINLTRATRGVSSIRGRTRGNTSGRGLPTSKSISAARGGDATPINTVAVRGSLMNRGKGLKDPLQRTKDDSIEKNASKKSEKKIYKVSLTNAVVKKLIAAKVKGANMKINTSDKMEIYTGEGEKIQLNLSSPKKVEMIFIKSDGIAEPVGNIIGYANNAISHPTANRDAALKKILKEGYEKEARGKRRVQVLEYDKIPLGQEAKTKSKRQKNNAISSIKVQQTPPMASLQVPSGKVSSQPSNAARGGKSLRGKTRGSRSRTAIITTATEVADSDDVVEATTTSTSARGFNVTRRSRGVKTIVPDVPKASPLATQSTRGKRGRPAGVTNRTARGAKTYGSMTTRTSSAFKKNDNEQQSSEGTASSSSKKEKGKGKASEQLSSSSEWKPGQMITILAEFRQARKICEDMENDIQEVIENLGEYENIYNYASSIKSTKGSTQDHSLRDIEKQFGEGSPANKLIQKYLQLEKDIKIIHDELWRAAEKGPVYED